MCKLCKEGICPREVIILKDKNGCTASRWRHLKKYHHAVHNKICDAVSQGSVIDMFSKDTTKKPNYSGLSDEHSREELIHFAIRSDCPFSLVDNRALKRLLSYFAQRGITLPSADMVQAAANQILKEGQEKLRRTLESVQRVSLTVDTWTSEDEILVLRITVYWINEGWTWCKRILAVEELLGPHAGNSMAEILLRVQKDFDLLEKVREKCGDKIILSGFTHILCFHIGVCHYHA